MDASDHPWRHDCSILGVYNVDTQAHAFNFSSQGYYVVHPHSLHVDSLVVAAGSDEFGKTIVDSGTTLTYIPKPMFARLVVNMDTFCGTHDSCKARKDQSNNHCWQLNDVNISPDDSFPTLQIMFDGTTQVAWKPKSYMSERGYGIWCLAIAPSANHDTILGISWMLHRDTIFDMGSRRIGMASADCPDYEKVPTTLWERIALSIADPPSAPFALLGVLLVSMAAVAIRATSVRAWQVVEPEPMRSEVRSGDTESLLEC